MSRAAADSTVLIAIVDWTIRQPRTTLAIWAVLCALSGWSASSLRIDTSMGSALNRTDQSWLTYQHSLERHGGDEFVTVALPPSDEAFGRRQLEHVLELTEAFEALEFVRRVDSLSTVALIRTEFDGSLNIGPGLSRGTLESDQSIQLLREQVRGDRILPGSIVSPDERVLAMNLIFEGSVDGDRESAVERIREILSHYQGATISGVPVVRADAGSRTRREILTFVPATIALVSVVVFSIFRRVQVVLVPLAVGGASSLVCLGVMASLGVTLSFSTSVLPSVILALGCAYAMHFLSAAEGCAGSEALSLSLVPVARPVVLSSVTTALGFLAMSISKIDLIRDLATYGALGAMLVGISTITIAPAMASLFPSPASASANPTTAISRVWAPVIVNAVLSYRRSVLVGWAVVIFAAALGLMRLSVSSDVILWFPEGGTLRESYETIRERLSGITPVNVLIEARNGGTISTPDLMRAIDALSNSLQAHPSVGKSISVADPLRQMHRELGGQLDSLPADQSTIDQYLLLLDGVEQMDDVISTDRLSANVLIRADNNSSADIVDLAKWVNDWWSRSGAKGYSASTTGIMYEFGRAQNEIAYGGILGLLLAVITIGVLLLLFFRDVGVAAVALVANVVPIAIIFGIVGWMGVPLDAATVCVASLSLGIAVDDTIHVVSGFQDRQGDSVDRSTALEGCLRSVLPALLFTTVTIAIGFGVLGVSGFTLVRNLGLMMASAAVICLLADVVLLPALLIGGDRQLHTGSR